MEAAQDRACTEAQPSLPGHLTRPLMNLHGIRGSAPLYGGLLTGSLMQSWRHLGSYGLSMGPHCLGLTTSGL